jgi:transcriptional regulator of acetoin/glycerol metabolism
MTAGPEIGVQDLPEDFEQDTYATSLQGLARLDELERSTILKTLEETDGHQQKAASKLGISKRTLQRKIKSYRLATDEVFSAAR